jgi:hypothetical protein
MTKFQDLIPGKFYWVNGIPARFEYEIAGQKRGAMASDTPWHPPMCTFDPNGEYKEISDEELGKWEEK